MMRSLISQFASSFKQSIATGDNLPQNIQIVQTSSNRDRRYTR
jgi:hypothetical protein